MGCDIHLYFEKKNKDGKWEPIEIKEGLVPDDRHYRLFGFLAGIRDDEMPPQFEGRGFPEDTSLPKYKIKDKEIPPCFKTDGRTFTDDENYFYIGDFGFTYAYLDEILRAPWKENDLDDCEFYAFCKHTLPNILYNNGLSVEDERNVRVIMGFDN